MDAEERFRKKRMAYVEHCIHVTHNIPLDLISMKWTLKHVSVKGEIVVKTCQSGSFKNIKYQKIETEVEGQMEKLQSKHSSQRLWAVERRGKNVEMKERLRVVKCTQQHRRIKEATEAQVKEAAGTSSKKLTVSFQQARDIKMTTTMTTQKKRRSERKGRRKTQTLQRWWRCATVFEKNRKSKQRRQQQQQKEKQRFGRHITNTYSWEQEDTITNTVLELCSTRSGGK